MLHPVWLAGRHLGAIPFDNLAFIALIIVAGFLRWISQQAKKAGKKSSPRGTRAVPPAPARREETDEERVRRFLEALGQPTSSKPPPKVTPRPIQKRTRAPRTRPTFSPLPPLTTVPPDIPPEAPISTKRSIPTRADIPSVFERRRDQEPIFEVPEVGPAPVESREQEISPVLSRPMLFPETGRTPTIYPEVATLLKTERGLREAIILREIFGPPRSLQSLDEPKSV